MNILAPSRIDEIICNGFQRVRLAGPDIDLSIPISIACYPEINGRKKLRVACCPCPTPYQARAGHPIVQHLECSNQFGLEQRSAAAPNCHGGQRSAKLAIPCERTTLAFINTRRPPSPASLSQPPSPPAPPAPTQKTT